MSSGRLLVMALNLRGPIPNAAAITSHLPDSVLLIRSKSHSEWGEDSLDESYERLQAWANGTLPELYGFDPDIELTKFGMRHAPEEPRTIPQIEVLVVEGLSSSSEEICDKITSICDSQGNHELRIDVAAGRKEDAAILARLPVVADLEGGCTVWYTDATSGTSVEIGGGLVEDGERPLSHMTRFWLNGSPILGFKRILWAKAMKGGLLTSVLDSVEEISKSPTKNQGKRIDLLIRDLDGRGIKVNKESWGYRAYREGEDPLDRWIPITRDIWSDSSGFWLEDIAALAIVDGWDCEHVYVGISIGHPNHENRMGSLRPALGSIYGGNLLSRVWSDLRAEGMLPPEFSGLDFLDTGSFNFREYSKKHHPSNEVEIWNFADRVVQDWRRLPLSLRNHLTPHCRTRDLDVFAETASNCLFVECKLQPDSTGGSVSGNKAQIDSIVASSASRGVNYSILTHAREDIGIWRSGAFDYIVPWSKLRRPGEMLKSVIKRKVPEEMGSRLSSRGPRAPAGGRGGKKRRRPPGALSKSRTLARELKETLDRGEISPEGAFELLFESITTSKKIEIGRSKDPEATAGVEGTGDSLKERVVKSGVFEKAIESGERTIHVVNAIQKAAGRGSWRDVFGAGKETKFVDYFNQVEPGLVRFRQGEDGDWYASQPDAANEEE